ncbi:hypothetical protein [Rhodovulum sulfidophilum]|uniref:hypothetical protein n=1 Tax=Rhodovulum sulfidophilum TaxID=35806 RepID=UPI001A55DBEB|nr:hypothetical protein [Rhodovulum sulfidophilum]MBL3575999.1 hypothetical protein [Rhodovulum sulfidophilum]
MKPRLNAGMGNAMLVAGSIPEACELFEIFRKSGSILADKCAIVTSYKRAAPEITGEETRMGETEKQRVHRVYTDLLGDTAVRLRRDTLHFRPASSAAAAAPFPVPQIAEHVPDLVRHLVSKSSSGSLHGVAPLNCRF